MLSESEKEAIRLTRLSKDLNNLFLPIIRHRGKKYFKEGRVELNRITRNLIKSTVRGSVSYLVSIDLKEIVKGSVRIGCTCPFFRQGIPCKHIWATIIAAERYFKENRDEADISKPSSLTVDEIFNQDEWANPAEQKIWQPIQDFVLRYEVKIHGKITLISAYEQYIKKDGNLGRTRKIKHRTLSNPDLPRADRLIIPFLITSSDASPYSYNSGYLFDNYIDNFREIPLSPEETATLLPLLSETGRCVVRDQAGKIHADPLKPLIHQKLKFRIKAKQVEKDKLAFVPKLELDGKQIALSRVLLINSSPVMIIFKGRLYDVIGPSYSLLKKILEKGIETTNLNKVPELLQHATKVSGGEHLVLPKKIAPKTREDIAPVGGLVLKIQEDRLVGEAFFMYDSLRVKASSNEANIFSHEDWMFIKRNFTKEEKLLDQILEAGFTYAGPDLLTIDLAAAPDALSSLDKKGVLLEAEDGKPFRTGSVRRLYISSGIDWFDMEAEINFGTESVPLPKVISAYLRGQKTIRLNSGGQGMLPLEWLQKHLGILQLAKADKAEDGKNVLRFPSSHALIIEHLLEEAQETRTDDRFKEVRKKLKNFKGIKSLKAPAGFKGKLRPYQREALGWFSFLHDLCLGGILADDMGLGKTVQVLAWLQKLKNKENLPSLIVAPTSLVFNWQAEAEKFTPNLKIFIYLGKDRKKQIKNLKDTDIVLTTYGIVRRDIETLTQIPFNYCILDESQYIKNPDSLTAKACRLLRAKHRLCLTGTPIENHLGELWSQMEFLNPGILGKKEQYMERFAKPAASGNKEVLNTLKKIVSPFILRRTKEEVAKELPDKIESIIRCTMTEEQQKLYQQIRDHYRSSIMQAIETKGIKRSKIMVLEGLLRLRQAANHPALVGATDCTSGKFQQLIQLLSETIDGGHKVLIFSQFTKMLKLIKDEMLRMDIPFEYLDGRTPQAKRKERVRNFQENDTIKAFLISLKAGGFGLNLTAADYVFIVDPWWNPAVELQAIDRTHRIGQTKKVVTYRLISKDSVEEKVLSLQKKKQEIVGSILSGSRNLLTDLTAKDLEILFS